MEQVNRISWGLYVPGISLNPNSITRVPTDQEIYFAQGSNFELIGAEISVDTGGSESVEVVSFSLVNIDANGSPVIPPGAAYFGGTGSLAADFMTATLSQYVNTLPGSMDVAQGLLLSRLDLKSLDAMSPVTFRITIVLTVRKK
jgi:hypothetical protein